MSAAVRWDARRVRPPPGSASERYNNYATFSMFSNVFFLMGNTHIKNCAKTSLLYTHPRNHPNVHITSASQPDTIRNHKCTYKHGRRMSVFEDGGIPTICLALPSVWIICLRAKVTWWRLDLWWTHWEQHNSPRSNQMLIACHQIVYYEPYAQRCTRNWNNTP